MKKLSIILTMIALFVINTRICAQNYSQHFIEGMNALVSGDYIKAEQAFKEGANLNDKYCCGRLGFLYFTGAGGIQKNETEAEKWLLKGYNMGNSYSAALLGLMWAENSQFEKALPILEYAYMAEDAEEKGVDVYGNVGMCIMSIYMEKNQQEKALEWCARVLRDYPDSPMINGYASWAYYDTHDYDKAVKHATIADKEGNLYGTYVLGVCMLYGDGMQKNEVAGFKKVRKVAYTESIDDAMRVLADLYYNGIGTPVDKAEAKVWYEKAAATGDEEARQKLSSLY